MPVLDDLPPLAPKTLAALLGLALLLWLALRVGLLRRRQRQRPPDEPPVSAPPWLCTLAAWPWTQILIALLAAGLVAAAAL